VTRNYTILWCSICFPFCHYFEIPAPFWTRCPAVWWRSPEGYLFLHSSTPATQNRTDLWLTMVDDFG